MVPVRAPDVVVFARHPLAARLLAETLSRDGNLAVVIRGPRRALDGSGQTPAVLVADADEVGTPLACYLDLISAAGRNALLVVGPSLGDAELRRLVPRGLRGFIAYSDIDRDLRGAVAAVRGGRTWFRRDMLERYLLLSSAEPSGEWRLSAREEGAVTLAGRGLSNKEIACALAISERTVRFHLQNSFAKLGVHNRVGLAEALPAATVRGHEKHAQ